MRWSCRCHVRRWLKSPPPAFGAHAEGLRAAVKAAELESERVQQEALYAFADMDTWGQPALPAQAQAANCAAYQSYLLTSFDATSLNVLLTACAQLKD